MQGNFFQQQQQNQIPMQPNIMQMNPLAYKKEQDKKEIIDVVQSYLNCLNIQSPLNSFKYMLYNRITDDSAHLINFLQQPKTQDITGSEENMAIADKVDVCIITHICHVQLSKYEIAENYLINGD